MSCRRVPEGLLDLFKEPIGKEIDESYLSKLKDSTTITVGDVVSLTVWRNGIVPVLSVYDGLTERHETTGFADLVKERGLEEMVVENPPGTVTDRLEDAIKQTMFGKPGIIRVIGEEDLALMPCILNAPDGFDVIYGWPKKGMMLVATDDVVRNKIRELWNKMEVLE